MKKTKKFLSGLMIFSFCQFAFADTCPGDNGVFNFDGSYPEGWQNSTKEEISKGEHNFLQVTWKPASGSKNMGSIYCTYSGSLVLANQEGSTPQPTNSNWKPSSIPDAYNCVKSAKDCEFTAATSNSQED